VTKYRYKYSDSDITFYLQCYRDFYEAESCLTALRRHYEDSRVIMISDGDDDRRYSQLASQFGVEYTAGERLFSTDNGGKMVQRMLDAFLAEPSDYLVKIDTDTRIHRRFRYLPEGRMLFGTLEWETSVHKEKLEFPNIQGGCVGFTREAAREIAESGILVSEDLLDYRNTYADNIDIIIRAEKLGLISTDFVTRYACRLLNIPMVMFEEVYCAYRARISPDGEGYAITHPHKHAIRLTAPWTYYTRIIPSLIYRRIAGAIRSKI
jgi:hypothetical protein